VIITINTADKKAIPRLEIAYKFLRGTMRIKLDTTRIVHETITSTKWRSFRDEVNAMRDAKRSLLAVNAEMDKWYSFFIGWIVV